MDNFVFRYDSDLPKDSFVNIVSNDNLYKEMSINKLLMIKTLLDIKELSDKNLKFIEKFKVDDFVIYEYQKIEK